MMNEDYFACTTVELYRELQTKRTQYIDILSGKITADTTEREKLEQVIKKIEEILASRKYGQ